MAAQTREKRLWAGCGGPKLLPTSSEVAFLAELANGALGDDPIGWPRLKDPARVRELFARTKPGYVLIAEIDASLTLHRGVTVQSDERLKCTE